MLNKAYNINGVRYHCVKVSWCQIQWRNYSSVFGANAPPKFFEKKIKRVPLIYIFTKKLLFNFIF